MSPTVLATVWSESGDNVDLLILWRGSREWGAKVEGSGSGGGGGSSSGHSRHDFINVSHGGLDLDVDIDFDAREVTIAGKHLSLGTDNVVLVDEVDSKTGPKIVRMLSIDREMPEAYPWVDALIRRSPILVSYVQCDATPPADAKALLASISCARILGSPFALEEIAVTVRLEEYARLVRAMDHAGIAALFVEDGEIVNPGQEPIRGPAAIERMLRQFVGYKVIDYQITPTRTIVDGDRAWQDGTFHQRVRTPDGKELEVSGHFATEWMRKEGGLWRIRRMSTTPQ